MTGRFPSRRYHLLGFKTGEKQTAAGTHLKRNEKFINQTINAAETRVGQNMFFRELNRFYVF